MGIDAYASKVPLNQNECFLYSDIQCLPSQIVYLAFSWYNLRYSLQDINVLQNEQYKSWFMKLNPSSKLPTFRQGNLIINTPFVIVEYAENYLTTESKLLPKLYFWKIKTYIQIIESLDFEFLKFYVITRPEMAKKTLIPNPILQIHLNNFYGKEKALDAFKQMNPKLSKYYEAIISAHMNLLQRLNSKSDAENIFLKLNSILDAIEQELMNSNYSLFQNAQSYNSNIFSKRKKDIVKTTSPSLISPIDRNKNHRLPIYLNGKKDEKPNALNYQKLETRNNLDYDIESGVAPLLSENDPNYQTIKQLTDDKTKLIPTPIRDNKANNNTMAPLNGPINNPSLGDSYDNKLSPPLLNYPKRQSTAPVQDSSKYSRRTSTIDKKVIKLFGTQDITAADIWLIALLNQLDILGLREQLWNGKKNLRPAIAKYYASYQRVMPFRTILGMYRPENEHLVQHFHTHRLSAAVEKNIVSPILACFGVRVPSQHLTPRAYKWWCAGITIGLTAITITSMSLLAYYIYTHHYKPTTLT